MSTTFYYSPMSSAVITHWALEELGVPVEKVKIDLAKRDQDKPEYKALNPNGKVPLLVVDGTPIFETIAILTYLGETFGVEKGLFPAPGLKRAEAMKWIVWASVTLGEALSRYQHASSDRIPKEQHNAAAAAKAKGDVENCLAILEGELTKTKKPYLGGDSFGIVDLHVAGWVGYLGMSGFDISKYATVDAWTKRSTQRPAFGKIMSERS